MITSVNKKPLLVIVHATTLYDRAGAAVQPIRQSLARFQPVCSVLEIEAALQRGKGRYLNLPDENRTSQEYHGNLINPDFLTQRAALIRGHDIFVFMGGKDSGCLINAFLSTLLIKLLPQQSLMAKNQETYSVQHLFRALVEQTQDTEIPSLTFHFLCHSIYPAEQNYFDLFPQNSGLNKHRQLYTLWSPNMPFHIFNVLQKRVGGKLERVGLGFAQHLNGHRIQGSSAAKIQLHYWTSDPTDQQMISSAAQEQAA